MYEHVGGSSKEMDVRRERLCEWVLLLFLRVSGLELLVYEALESY
jgi:hypothetical protein